MKIPFPRTARWMQDDRSPLPRSVLLLLLLASVGWAVWFFLGRVHVYAVAQSARTEVDRLAHTVQAPVGGVVQASNLVLGHHVEQGDVVMVIDSTSERLQVAQETAKAKGQQRAMEVLERELRAERDAMDVQARALGVAAQAAQARGRVAVAMQDYAAEENKMMQQLRSSALATGLETLKSASEARRQQAEAAATSLEASRIAASGQTDLKDRAVRVVKLEHEVAMLQAEIEMTNASVARLEFEIERRTIRAAVSGLVADLSPTPPGTTLSTGQRLGVIVPPGSSRVVARFAPAEAIGRVKAGQTAVVRLDAFPWTEYGVLKARVAQVAREPQDGQVRTEFELLPGNTTIPLGHGLTGTVEIELEETSPFHLLLRAAGQLAMGAPASAAPSTDLPPSARLP